MQLFEKSYVSEIKSSAIIEEDLTIFLNTVEIPTKKRFSILLAVSEIFNNALIHGNKFDKSKNILVRIEVNEKNIIADIIDQGMNGESEIKNRKKPNLDDESGRGIVLVEKFSSQVKYKNEEDGGLRVSLVFDLTGSALSTS